MDLMHQRPHGVWQLVSPYRQASAGGGGGGSGSHAALQSEQDFHLTARVNPGLLRVFSVMFGSFRDTRRNRTATVAFLLF